MPETNWQASASSEVILERALMLKNVRAFFDARGVIEVETPLLSSHSTTDPHLDSLQSAFRGRPCFLNTSPEYAMKRLLACWGEPIYQICKAFRDDELGPNHNPEFTMLEWYRPGFDMRQLMAELAELVAQLFLAVKQDRPSVKTVDAPRYNYLSYQQAFESFAGINPHQVTSADCYQLAVARNVEIPQGLVIDDALDDWLDWLLLQLVLPAFAKNCFTFMYDYPASQSALARVAENEQQFLVAKRFELFYGDIELANGFYELTDANEQMHRFQQENLQRNHACKPAGCIDDFLIAALKHGLPDCSGVAVGLDRLLMALTDKEAIEEVLIFPWDRA